VVPQESGLRRETPQEESGRTPKGLSLSSPRVRDWLREHNARFALMDDETFGDHVLRVPLDLGPEGKPEGIDRLLREVEAENDAVVEALRAEPRHGGTLFPKIRRDTPEDEIRDILRESWRLERDLQSLYNRRRRIVAHISRALYDAGFTYDFLTDPHRVEEERAKALEAAFAAESVA
jgi:hypothetical protein